MLCIFVALLISLAPMWRVNQSNAVTDEHRTQNPFEQFQCERENGDVIADV